MSLWRSRKAQAGYELVDPEGWRIDDGQGEWNAGVVNRAVPAVLSNLELVETTDVRMGMRSRCHRFVKCFDGGRM